MPEIFYTCLTCLFVPIFPIYIISFTHTIYFNLTAGWYSQKKKAEKWSFHPFTLQCRHGTFEATHVFFLIISWVVVYNGLFLACKLFDSMKNQDCVPEPRRWRLVYPGPAVAAACVHKADIRYLKLQALLHARRLWAQEGTRQLRACWGLARIGQSPGGLN